MYWCEGDKSTESRTFRVALTSSDVTMLKLFVEWLERHYRVKRERIKLRLHLWSNLDEEVAKQFWSSGLGISNRNFTKSWTKPKGKGRRIHPHGVCRASISSKKLLDEILTDIAHEFQASIA